MGGGGGRERCESWKMKEMNDLNHMSLYCVMLVVTPCKLV